MSTRLFRSLGAFVLTMVALAGAVIAQSQQPAAPPRTINLQDTIPFDAAVHTATLPNGLKYFVRQNSRPAKRVLLRLAVKTGSLYENDDQLGLAHLIEHMAFNGTTHFKPGELVSYFESIGSRLGPHVNAYTGFEETVYMFDVPADKPEVVEKALTALADFAGGLSLTQEEVDKERGVVIEEWRGGLGAGSRVRDKQFPILFYHSRYADRLPIGKPDVIRNAPVARLRALYDTWYRPDRMAVIAVGDIDPTRIERTITSTFSPLAPRAPAAALPDHTVPLHKDALVSVVTDPELTRSSVSIERKRPREGEQRVADYRRDLVQRMVERMMDERLSELARKPDAKFLSAGVGGGSLSRDVATFSMSASVQDGKLEDGIGALATEAKRVREFGFGASEMDRAKTWMAAFYERAYAERDKTESGSFAREYVSYFLNGEPSSGIEYEYRLVQQLLPGQGVADDARLRFFCAAFDLHQPAIARAAAVLGNRLRDDAARRIRRAVHDLRAGVLMLAGGGKRDREDFAASARLHHVHGRILHRQPAAQVAVDPFHQRAFVGHGPLGHQVVNVVGPVLDGGVAAAGVLFDDDLDHGRVQAFGGVHRGGAALDIVHLGPFVDDDQRPLELPHVLGVDAEIGLQRKLDLHALGHVDERPARPDGRIEGRELVVGRRNDLGEIFAHQVRMLADRRIGVGEDHALAAQVFFQRAVDHFAFELGLHAGQELLFGLGNAQPIERLLDFLRHFVPGFALLIGRLQVVENVLEVDGDISAPVRHRLGVENLQALRKRKSRIQAGSPFISEIWLTISASIPLRALKTYFDSVRKSYLLISPIAVGRLGDDFSGHRSRRFRLVLIVQCEATASAERSAIATSSAAAVGYAARIRS